MPQAIHCNTVQEVRHQIDRHDTLFVNLLAERTDYVFQAARFKNTGRGRSIPRPYRGDRLSGSHSGGANRA